MPRWVRLRSPKGDIWKQTLLKKSVTFYTNPAIYVAVGRKVWSSKGPNFGLIQPLQLLTPPSNSAFCGQRCRSYQRFAVYRCHTGICLNCTCSKDHLNEVMNDRENQKTPSSLDGKKKRYPWYFPVDCVWKKQPVQWTCPCQLSSAIRFWRVSINELAHLSAGMGTQDIAIFLDDWPMELGYICTQYPIFVQTQMLFRAFLEIL